MAASQIGLPAIILSASIFVLLGYAWVSGYDIVKVHAPENLPRFWMVLASVRLIVVSALVAVYVIFFSSGIEESKSFVLMILAMYALMMTITLILRH